MQYFLHKQINNYGFIIFEEWWDKLSSMRHPFFFQYLHKCQHNDLQVQQK